MTSRKPYQLIWKDQTLTLGDRTRIMGVLNVTPDSFSDGGSYEKTEAAIAQGEKLAAQGADILDIGGESTRPFADPVPAEEEIRRVGPVIKALAGRVSIPISVDTTKTEVAREALALGASIINDVSALRMDAGMGTLAASSGVPVVLMHMLGSPRTMQRKPFYRDVVGDIYTFLEDAIGRAVTAGIARDRIIVDPGIGFGKNLHHNLELIRKLDRFQGLDAPILIGPSRKAFIRKLLSEEFQEEIQADRPVVETGTLAAVCAAALNGAHLVRVHDVAGARAALKIIDALREG